MASADPALRPVFIESPSGRLFGVYRTATSEPGRRRSILFVPPFTEEMNRSRRMAALQAQALASSGVDSLLLDLFGTGDSEGDFGEARLSHWLADIAAAADWLEAQGSATPCLWGLRLGALLACTVAAAQPDRFKELLLWQPVTDAKLMLTQFLRVRVAAAMAEGGAPEKTEELRARFASGVSVEVAGYELSPELAQALDALRLDRLSLAADAEIDWLEVGAEAGDQLSPASERAAAIWRKAGARLRTTTVVGEPFWTLQETTLAPALIAATTRLFQS